MYYYLSGTVAHIEPFLAVIDCGGVGYACRTTSFTPISASGRTPWTSTASPVRRSGGCSSF